MAKKALIAKRNGPRSMKFVSTTAAKYVAGPEHTCVNLDVPDLL